MLDESIFFSDIYHLNISSITNITAISFGFIQKTSSYIGTEDLSETYKKLLFEDNSIGRELLNVAIKLNYYHNFPESEIKKINEFTKNHNNFLSNTIVKEFFLNYVYMFELDSRTGQRMCSTLDISSKEIKKIAYNPRSKK